MKKQRKAEMKNQAPAKKRPAANKRPPKTRLSKESGKNAAETAAPAHSREQKRVPKIRVCVPYPNHGAISPETQKSLNLLKQCPDIFVEIMEIQGSSISFIRNVGVNRGACEKVRQGGFDYDYYLSVDADIAFKPEHLLQLLKRDLDVVGAAYQYRAQTDLLVAGHFANSEGVVRAEEFLPIDTLGVKEVDWIGAGFTLIKKHVFEAMDYPWYREQIVEFDDAAGEKSAVWVGEDVGLCLGARKKGFKIYCDCDCHVRHLVNSGSQTSKSPFMNKDSYTVDEAAGLAFEMLEHIKALVSGFHRGLKDVEANMKN
ncbi:MAG: hypothetical protein LBB56_05120 [Chitinispirillales bacterium]|jgi:hypothetical protein|nr:hypothetical protein [Chitinispirillales bacterium]